MIFSHGSESYSKDGNVQGIRRRKVSCVSADDGLLQGESICTQSKPAVEEVCSLHACHNSVPQVGFPISQFWKIFLKKKILIFNPVCYMFIISILMNWE